MHDDDTLIATLEREARRGLDELNGGMTAAERARLAREHKAFQRAREIPDADTLLLLLLVYTGASLSLRVTAWFARVALGHTLTDESLRGRFLGCGPWLQALVLSLLSRHASLPTPLRTRVRLVDSSVLCRPGAKGTEWRVHVIFDPGSSTPTSVEVTDAHGAEGLDRGVHERGALALGDRNYGRYREVKAARDRLIELLARTHLPSQRMRTPDGLERTPQHWTDAADRGAYDHPVELLRGDDPPLPARLIVVPLPVEAANRARQRLRKAASKKGRMPNAAAMHVAGYLCLLTTVDAAVLSVAEACSLYRIRWAIELFFKRCKSLGALGNIRGKTALVEVQIWARLLALCSHEMRRPLDASVRPARTTPTGRPPTLWRWLQCFRLVWLAPLMMLAAVGARMVPARSQDDVLRERPRKRGLHAYVDSLAPFTGAPA